MLTSVLSWKEAAATFAVGAVLILVAVAAYEASKQFEGVAPAIRLTIFIAILGGAMGYSSQRIKKSLEFKEWVAKQ